MAKYLDEMPKRILFGQAKGIEKWCKDNGKAIPTLLDLGAARARRKFNEPMGRRKARNK